jgi:hypothetical protein
MHASKIMKLFTTYKIVLDNIPLTGILIDWIINQKSLFIMCAIFRHAASHEFIYEIECNKT